MYNDEKSSDLHVFGITILGLEFLAFHFSQNYSNIV